MKFLITLMVSVSLISIMAGIPDPNDPDTWLTITNLVPHPPRSSPPVAPYKGNIYEATTNSITFFNDVSPNARPLDVLWKASISGSNAWEVVGNATNKFIHNKPEGFYGVRADDELELIRVIREY